MIPDAHEVEILPFRKKMLAAENPAGGRTSAPDDGGGAVHDLISTHTSLAAFFTRVAARA